MLHSLSEHNRRETGIVEQQEKLTLDIDDGQLIRSFKKRVKDSQNYWEQQLRLKQRRELMRRYWKGDHETMPMYDYQYPKYVDNRFYMHCEHVVQTVNAQTPEPIAVSFDRDEESKRLAHDFGEYLFHYAQNKRWNDIDRIATRHLLLYFLGVEKIFWDENAGPIGDDGKPIGDVAIKYVRPQNIVVDKNALVYGNPTFVAEIVHDTLEEMLEKFPDKKDEILQNLGMRGVTTQMSAVIGYWEVHFSYFNKQGAPREAVVHFSPDFDIVLKKEKSADWDEEGETDEDGERRFRNLLERPGKPYAFLHMNTLGENFIDETSPLEQILPMQDHLNKRGQQISDMADEQKGGKVFNKKLVNKADASRFTNDPGSHLMVNGPSSEAFTRVAPELLPNYVIDDKFDARQEGDNIIGVHGPTRGEREGDDQPTTIQLLKEGDFQRRGDLINGIERMNEYKYQYAAHLMKLNYTEEHWTSVAGEDGRKTFMRMTSEEIPRMAVTVKAGTTLPTDKITQREEAMELMRLGKIDYITFFERLGFPNPKEQAFKLFQHESNPQSLYASPDEAEEAEEDIARLKKGETPELPDEITEGYLAAMTEFLKSSDFQNLVPDDQTNAAQYIRQVIERAREGAATPAQPAPEGVADQQAQQMGGQQQGQQASPQGPLSAIRGGLRNTASRAANGIRNFMSQ